MISYPITDRENRTFTFISPTFGRYQGKKWPVGDGSELPNPEPGLVILEEFYAPDPVVSDPATEKLDSGQWIDDEPNQTTTFTRSVVARSAEEQTEYAADQEIEANRVTLASKIASYQADYDALIGVTVAATAADVAAKMNILLPKYATLCRDFAYVLKWLDKRLG